MNIHEGKGYHILPNKHTYEILWYSFIIMDTFYELKTEWTLVSCLHN